MKYMSTRMIKNLTCGFLFCIPALVCADGTAYQKFQYEKNWFHSVISDLNREEITTTAHYSPRLTRFWSVASQYQPIAAITGTFFAWENQQPVADVIIDGQQKASGKVGSVLAVDWYGRT